MPPNLTHSMRAKMNMTKQIMGQLITLLLHLEKKENRLKKSNKMLTRFPRLGRGIRWTIRRQQKGIAKVLTDIDNIRMRIDKREKRGEIFHISF